MCKLAFVSFDDNVPQPRRHEVVSAVLERSWEMGNKDGVGLATWNAAEEPVIGRALKITELALPETIGRHVLVHARFATCDKGIQNVHPIEGGGAYLVHNGIVDVVKAKDEATYKSKTKTTNDSELILKAYLCSGRDLKDGLKRLSGQANVALWDRERLILSIFPDGEDFQMWLQDGVFLMVQKQDQTSGSIVSGLDRPYSFDRLSADRVYEVNLADPAVKVSSLFTAAVKTSREYLVTDRSYTISNGLSSVQGDFTVYDNLWDEERIAINQTEPPFRPYVPGQVYPSGYRNTPKLPKNPALGFSKKSLRALKRAMVKRKAGGYLNDLSKSERKAYDRFMAGPIAHRPTTPSPRASHWWQAQDAELAARMRREALDKMEVEDTYLDPDDVSPKYPTERLLEPTCETGDHFLRADGKCVNCDYKQVHIPEGASGQ